MPSHDGVLLSPGSCGSPRGGRRRVRPRAASRLRRTDGAVVRASGATRSGKSTLIAALIAQRFEYLTTDVVPVELATARVRPLTRPSELDDHSMIVLSGTRRVGPHHVEPTAQADSLVALAEQSVQPAQSWRRRDHAPARVTRDAPSYRLVCGDPHGGAEAVVEALARSVSSFRPTLVQIAPSSQSGHRMCPGTGMSPV